MKGRHERYLIFYMASSPLTKQSERESETQGSEVKIVSALYIFPDAFYPQRTLTAAACLPPLPLLRTASPQPQTLAPPLPPTPPQVRYPTVQFPYHYIVVRHTQRPSIRLISTSSTHVKEQRRGREKVSTRKSSFNIHQHLLG